MSYKVKITPFANRTAKKLNLPTASCGESSDVRKRTLSKSLANPRGKPRGRRSLIVLSPDIKKAAKAALKELAQNPFLGKELQAELNGFWSYKFMRYRIVFKADPKEKVIVIWAIGHRRDIYETLSNHLLSL